MRPRPTAWPSGARPRARGQRWAALGSAAQNGTNGSDGTNNTVNTLAIIGTELYVGGSFDAASSSSQTTVAASNFTVFGPVTGMDILVEQPVNAALTDGTSTIDFGTVNQGAAGTPVTITIKNPGTTALVLGTISADGTNSSEFTTTAPLSSVVLPGGGTTFTVSFSPTSSGAKTATLSIASNDPDETPFTLALTSSGLSVIDTAVISAGASLTLFLKTDGTIWATGNNSYGQFGNGGTNSTATPVQVMAGFRSIATGQDHSLFLKTDGTVWASGRNVSGQLGDGTTTGKPTPVQAISGVSGIAAGNYHSLYLKPDGSVWAAGSNGNGQLGDGTTALKSTPVQVMSDVKAISAGGGSGGVHSLFLKTNGTVWATGNNGSGQLGDGTLISKSTPFQVMTGVQAIAAGGDHSLFLKSDGTVWATGANAHGQLGDGTTVSKSTPVQIMSGVRSISARYFHSLFIKTDGTAWATGNNNSGQLGNGTTINRSTPIQVITGVKAVSAGYSHSLFLKTNGTLWATGLNISGQLGVGTFTNSTIPIKIMQVIANPAIAWQYEQFDTDAENPTISDWTADPDHDGISNTLERAFNLNPTQPGRPILLADTGSSGLPLIRRTGEPPIFSIQYLRRKASTNSGLNYTPQFGSSMAESGPDGWTAATGTEIVESIDTEWERVTVEEDAIGKVKRFGRVKVTAAP